MRRFFTACLLAGSLSGLAMGGQDIEGSKDSPLVSRYPGSRIIGYVTREFDEYLFPTGKVADDKPTKSEHLEGKVTRITYLTPNGRSTLEVYRNFESALKQAGFQTLFSCSAEDCGSGNVVQSVNTDNVINFWNNGFAQRHVSAKLKRAEGDVYVSLPTTELLAQRRRAARPVRIAAWEQLEFSFGPTEVPGGAGSIGCP